MPVLKNPKHERLAQELAKGKSATEAMEKVGYSDPRNSTRLTKNDEIRARVAELQERGAAKAELSIQSATEALLRIAKKGEDLADAPGLNVAKGAWMDACKVAGLIIDKKEVGRPGDFERMSEDELDAFIAARQNSVGAGDSGEAEAGNEKGVRKSRGLH